VGVPTSPCSHGIYTHKKTRRAGVLAEKQGGLHRLPWLLGTGLGGSGVCLVGSFLLRCRAGREWRARGGSLRNLDCLARTPETPSSPRGWRGPQARGPEERAAGRQGARADRVSDASGAGSPALARGLEGTHEVLRPVPARWRPSAGPHRLPFREKGAKPGRRNGVPCIPGGTHQKPSGDTGALESWRPSRGSSPPVPESHI
jgi:hypothetical protein